MPVAREGHLGPLPVRPLQGQVRIHTGLQGRQKGAQALGPGEGNVALLALLLGTGQSQQLGIQGGAEGVEDQAPQILGPAPWATRGTPVPSRQEGAKHLGIQLARLEAGAEGPLPAPFQAHIDAAGPQGLRDATELVGPVGVGHTGLHPPAREAHEPGLAQHHIPPERQGLKLQHPLTTEQALEGLQPLTEGQHKPLQGQAAGAPVVAPGLTLQGEPPPLPLQGYASGLPTPIEPGLEPALGGRGTGHHPQGAATHGSPQGIGGIHLHLQPTAPGFL